MIYIALNPAFDIINSLWNGGVRRELGATPTCKEIRFCGAVMIQSQIKFLAYGLVPGEVTHWYCDVAFNEPPQSSITTEREHVKVCQ